MYWGRGGGILTAESVLTHIFFSSDVENILSIDHATSKLICDVLLKKSVYYNIPLCEKRLFISEYNERYIIPPWNSRLCEHFII